MSVSVKHSQPLQTILKGTGCFNSKTLDISYNKVNSKVIINKKETHTSPFESFPFLLCLTCWHPGENNLLKNIFNIKQENRFWQNIERSVIVWHAMKGYIEKLKTPCINNVKLHPGHTTGRRSTSWPIICYALTIKRGGGI